MEFNFKPLPVIDAHIHFTDLTQMNAILDISRQVPMEKVNLLSVGVPRHGSINQNPELIAFKDCSPATTYISGGLDYTQVMAGDWASVDPNIMSATLGRQVEMLKAIGFDGVKLIESKPTVRKAVPIPLDAANYEGMWATLEDLEMPVLWHVADPEEFWDPSLVSEHAKERGWFYGDGTYPTKEALYREVDNVLARHPALKIIFAHFYFLSADLERAARFLDAHPGVCFDLTPGNEMIFNFTRNYDAAHQFFIDYQDRIVYGTDIATWGLNRPNGMAHALGTAWAVRMYLETTGVIEPPAALAHWRVPDLPGFRGFALPDSVLAKIYKHNFERLYGERPAILDCELAFAEIERMAEVIDASSTAEVSTEPGAVNPARQVLEFLTG
jgi:hypothetical protein